MSTRKGTFFLFVFLAAAWLLIVSSVRLSELIIGAVVVVAVIIATRQARVLYGGLKLSFKLLIFAPLYFLVFLWQLILSNFDVARRVLSPSLPINPGIVKVHTKLDSSIGKLILANSITLTPGTLTLDAEGDSLFIHWIDVKGENADAASESIVAGFERWLKEIAE